MESAVKLRIINIAPLFAAHKAEISCDLLQLQRECGVTDVAFMLPLVPEEPNPTMAKPERLRDLFLEMRSPLLNSGLRVGILIQSTLGHGTFSSARFTRIVNAKGMTTSSMCPLDSDLQDYIGKAVATVAATKPDFLILDDDFRLANSGAPGCFCKLHMTALEEVTGRKFDRESLLDALDAGMPETDQLKRMWEKVRLESLLVLARKIRVGIDSANTGLPCGYGICDAGGMELQFAHAIEAAISGGNPQFVRVNNAWYQGNDGKGLLSRLYWSSAQMETMKDMPEILAESDTYPHNRYCTPAKALDAQIVFSLAIGCTGLKLWITRLFGFEPESGAAYRQMLKRKIGAYRELRRLVGQVKWNGPTVPLCYEIAGIPAAGSPERNENWSCAVLGHMGIPCRIGYNSESSVFMLAGTETERFSEDELKKFLSKSVLLDGAAAANLCRRGLSDFIGLSAESTKNWRANVETVNGDAINGKACNREIVISALISGEAFRLVPLAGTNVRILSRVAYIPFYLSPDKMDMGPGLVLFGNSLGGRVATFASVLGFTPFMNETRREQLFSVLGWLNRKPLPLVVDSDVDVFAMHGAIASGAGGGELLVMFNLNMDSLDCLTLRLGGAEPSEILMLKYDGTWGSCVWRKAEGSSVVIETRVDSVAPIILKIMRDIIPKD